MKDYSTNAFHGIVISSDPLKARTEPFVIEGTKIYITEDTYRYKVQVIEEFKGRLDDDQVYILNRNLPIGEEFIFWVTGPTTYWLTIHHFEPYRPESKIQIRP